MSDPTDPPSAQLRAMSLSKRVFAKPRSRATVNQATPRTSNPSSGSFSSHSSSSSNVFVFGQQSPRPSVHPRTSGSFSSPPPTPNTPSQQSSSPGPVFRFGGSDSQPLVTPSQHSSGPGPVLRFGGSDSPSPSTPSPQRGSPSPVFHFGPSSSKPPPFPPPTVNTPEHQSTSPSPAFNFGASTSQPFSFHSLHNVTPLPSPTPSRGTSPQLSATTLQSPFRFDSSPPMSGSQTASNPNMHASVFGSSISLTVPSTPPSAGRSRALSLTSPPSSIPGQPPDTTPNTQQRFRSASEVSTPITQTSAVNPPYDAQAESAPAHSFFTPVFQTALKNGSTIAKDAFASMEKLGSCGLAESDADLRRLMEDAKGLRKFQGSDTRTIAVLGDSGEGKSSLINSLLHVPEIAQTGDIGSACTSVVTEYRQKKAEHVAPMTIEVEYLSASGMKELVTELLWSYRQLYLPGVESDETPEQDYARYMRESDQAWSALQSAFRHQRQFTKEFLRDMSEGALEKLTNQVLQWVSDIEWPSGGNDGFWVSTAQTAEECCNKTKVFMQDKYWPFTKIIRVYLNSQVLKTGVVLADLPGLQDTNMARVRATQDYLIKCDNIFIVAKISRAITDQSLKSSLFWVISRHVPMEWEKSGGKNFKLAVVCTKSEEINQRTARTEFCGPNKRILPETMEKLDKEIETAKAAGDRVAKKTAKRRQERILMQARNDYVKEGLQRTYAADMEGGALNVFCVSNTMYQKYCPKGNTESVIASGIPDLRHFCHSMTADAQLGESKHFLRSKLSTLINSLELWTNSHQNTQLEEEVDLAESIYDDLNSVIREFPKSVTAFRQGFNTCFQEQIMDLLAKRDQHWEQVASGEGRKWHSWHWSTLNPDPDSTSTTADRTATAQYRAWCRNNGNHQTAGRDHEDWNAKIIWKMRMELEYQWDLVEDEAPEVFSVLLDATKSLLERLKMTIQGYATSDCVTPLVSSIDFQIQNLEYLIKREERTFVGEVKSIRRYASESNSNSYILKEMVPSYRSASSQSGSGMAARQRGIVQGRIEDGSLFPNLGISISTSMEELITSTENKLTKHFNGILESIKRDVDMVFQHQTRVEQRPRESDEERENLLKQLAVEVNGLKQRHGLLLQTIEAL